MALPNGPGTRFFSTMSFNAMSFNASEWIPVFQDSGFMSSILQGNAVGYASAATLSYDYLLTLSDEIGLMWQPAPNLSAVLYLIIRYGSLLTMVLSVVYDSSVSPQGEYRLTSVNCQTLQGIVPMSQLISTAAASAFIAVRIMALWSSNWALGALLFILGLINSYPAAQLLSFAFNGTRSPYPLIGCFTETHNITLALYASVYLPIALSVVNMLYEFLCFGLTIVKTYRVYQTMRELHLETPSSLTYLLLRNGSLYFIVMIICGIVNVISATMPDSSPFSGWALNEYFGRSLVPILTMRFIADLRRAYIKPNASSDVPSFSAVRFVGRTRTERLLEQVAGSVDLTEDVVEDPDAGDDAVAAEDVGETSRGRIADADSA
ncbi:hypothetical protein BD414DRAFT_8963 [Trametes punicea]|nr:hypothetical protein BD414DRAFT_8963 [Trametes punicea]